MEREVAHGTSVYWGGSPWIHPLRGTCGALIAGSSLVLSQDFLCPSKSSWDQVFAFLYLSLSLGSAGTFRPASLTFYPLPPLSPLFTNHFLPPSSSRLLTLTTLRFLCSVLIEVFFWNCAWFGVITSQSRPNWSVPKSGVWLCACPPAVTPRLIYCLSSLCS